MFEVETIESAPPSDEALCQSLANAAGLSGAPKEKIREALKQVPQAQSICKAIGVLPTGPRLAALEEVLNGPVI